MCKAIKDAMPVGSRWSAFHHPLNKTLGERTVKGHRSRDMILVNHAKNDGDSFLGYPKAYNVKVTTDTVIILDDMESNAGNPLLTYTRIK